MEEAKSEAQRAPRLEVFRLIRACGGGLLSLVKEIRMQTGLGLTESLDAARALVANAKAIAPKPEAMHPAADDQRGHSEVIYLVLSSSEEEHHRLLLRTANKRAAFAAAQGCRENGFSGVYVAQIVAETELEAQHDGYFH